MFCFYSDEYFFSAVSRFALVVLNNSKLNSTGRYNEEPSAFSMKPIAFNRATPSGRFAI
jgi:hypothetical protein